MDKELVRQGFEAAVIERFKESGFLEVEVRVECLGRSGYGDGYIDQSVDAYWHFWKASREAVVVELPGSFGAMTHPCADKEQVMDAQEVREAIEALGLKVKP